MGLGAGCLGFCEVNTRAVGTRAVGTQGSGGRRDGCQHYRLYCKHTRWAAGDRVLKVWV